MTTDPIADIARAVAQQLTTDHGPGIAIEVEAALHNRPSQPERFTDPIAIGGLVVAIVTLVWTVYNDLKSRTPESIARKVRIKLEETHTVDESTRRIIDITVEETVKY